MRLPDQALSVAPARSMDRIGTWTGSVILAVRRTRAFVWFEHFCILPFRWWRVHCQNWREARQRCKVCGCADGFNFHVPDEVWEAVVPRKFQTRVVCLRCFDRFAKEKEVDYATSILDFCFAGDQCALFFSVLPQTNKRGD